MSLNYPGYTVANGCMVFRDPIERMEVEMVNGVVTLLVVTCQGVTRVPAHAVPVSPRPRLRFLIHRPKDPHADEL